MSFFTPERLNLAMLRTEKQFHDAKKYAFQNQVQASGLVGAAFLVGLYFPGSFVFTLCVSALALICFNLFKEPGIIEVATLTAYELSNNNRF